MVKIGYFYKVQMCELVWHGVKRISVFSIYRLHTTALIAALGVLLWTNDKFISVLFYTMCVGNEDGPGFVHSLVFSHLPSSTWTLNSKAVVGENKPSEPEVDNNRHAPGLPFTREASFFCPENNGHFLVLGVVKMSALIILRKKISHAVYTIILLWNCVL